MKFGGQTSKNVNDIHKVYLETTLCVYVFFLDEMDVKGPKLIY